MMRRFISGIGRAGIPVLVLAFLQFPLIQAADARPHAVTPRVFPPNSNPYGRSYSEWSMLNNQALLAGGDLCELGRVEHVQFLPIAIGGNPIFACEVPAGTALLTVLVEGIFWCPDDCQPGGAAPNGTVEELRAAAAIIREITTVAELEIDGVPVRDVWSYLVQSPVFSGSIGPDNIFGLPPHEYGPAVSEGFWIMIEPLPVGEHMIFIHVVLGDPDDPILEATVAHNVTVVAGEAGRSTDALAVEPTTWGAIKAVYR